MSSSSSQQLYRKNQRLYFNPNRRNISTLIIAKKTLLFDLYSVQKLIASIFFMVIVPIIAQAIVTLPSDASLYTEGFLSFILYFYTYGLVFPIIIVASAGPLIAEEVDSGTMLILVSKPIDRTRIMLGKFIGLFLFGMIINIIALSIISIMAAGSYPAGEIPIFFGINLIYSTIILLFFGGFTLGLSGAFRKPKNVIMLPLMIVIFAFLIMMIFRMLLVSSGAYEDFQLYHFDIAYHLGNVYLGIIEVFIPSIWEEQQFVGLFAYFGLIRFRDFTNEHGYPDWEMFAADYYLPAISLIAIILIVVILLAIGTYRFYKREVSV